MFKNYERFIHKSLSCDAETTLSNFIWDYRKPYRSNHVLLRHRKLEKIPRQKSKNNPKCREKSSTRNKIVIFLSHENSKKTSSVDVKWPCFWIRSYISAFPPKHAYFKKLTWGNHSLRFFQVMARKCSIELKYIATFSFTKINTTSGTYISFLCSIFKTTWTAALAASQTDLEFFFLGSTMFYWTHSKRKS